jgi:hypothetical protein
VPPKKPQTDQPDFADARRACRTPAEREQLALVLRARWTSAELEEFARLYYFKNGRDYPTPWSYRQAIADLAQHYHLMTHTDAPPSKCPHEWLTAFRKGGSKITPPRREGLLVRGRGLTHKINCEEYAWPEHSEELRSMVEMRCRDYFNITPDQRVHVNAWAASWRAYRRELSDISKAAEFAKYSLLSKCLKQSPPTGYKVASSFSYIGRSFVGGSYTESELRPHFGRDFKTHTPEFREHVAALARSEQSLRPKAKVSRALWQATCHKHFIIIESNIL